MSHRTGSRTGAMPVPNKEVERLARLVLEHCTLPEADDGWVDSVHTPPEWSFFNLGLCHVETPKGEHRSARVQLEILPFHIEGVWGMKGALLVGKGGPKIEYWLNISIPTSPPGGHDSESFQVRLHSLIHHELTHLADPTIEKGVQKTTAKGSAAYFNKPMEVTARVAQVVRELSRESVQWAAAQDLEMFMYYSPTWERTWSFYTPENRRRFRRAGFRIWQIIRQGGDTPALRFNGNVYTFQREGDACGRGQYNETIYALLDGVRVGYLSVSIYNGRYQIESVEVLPEYRRRGAATALYLEMFRESGIRARDLTRSYRTEEGAAFRAALAKKLRVTERLAERRRSNAARWGRQGAGAIIYCPSTNRVLLGLRSGDVMEPGTWGGFGGKIDDGDTDPLDAALREVSEELGVDPAMFQAAEHLWTYEEPGFRYFNYLVTVGVEFEPDLNWENDDFGWFTLARLPTPLHYGFEALLPYLRLVVKKRL